MDVTSGSSMGQLVRQFDARVFHGPAANAEVKTMLSTDRNASTSKANIRVTRTNRALPSAGMRP